MPVGLVHSCPLAMQMAGGRSWARRMTRKDRTERSCTPRSMNLLVVGLCKRLNINIPVPLALSNLMALMQDHHLVIPFGFFVCFRVVSLHSKMLKTKELAEGLENFGDEGLVSVRR